MKLPARSSLLGLLPLAALLLLSSACTAKGTTKATTDPTIDILSSTTGKSWFTEDGLVKDDHKVDAFATLNFENLREDMAQGRGEYLASLATLLSVPNERQGEFFRLTQEKYPILFHSEQTTPGEMLAALTREMPAIRP